MKTPPKPADEAQRLETLRALNILDSSPDERFDRLTRLAKRLFGVPIALVSLIDEDRQWFKSRQGLDASETPREISFCGHAILGDDIFMVPDATLDERFHDNPLVTGAPDIRFYAGCPLAVADGSKLGTLCIIDSEPRQLSDEDRGLLHDLASIAEQELSALQLATVDGLTLLSNRRGFMALAQQTIDVCLRLNEPVSLLFFDLDRFKEINDNFGHAEGDNALRTFAGLLQENFRGSDVIGRLGGDEFAVLACAAEEVGIPGVLHRLHESAERINRASGRGYDIAYSVGAVEFNASRHGTVAELLGEADTLMYRHKRERRITETPPTPES